MPLPQQEDDISQRQQQQDAQRHSHSSSYYRRAVLFSVRNLSNGRVSWLRFCAGRDIPRDVRVRDSSHAQCEVHLRAAVPAAGPKGSAPLHYTRRLRGRCCPPLFRSLHVRELAGVDSK